MVTGSSEALANLATIKVVGVGGGGVNTVDRICMEKVPGVHLIAVNTDAKALARSKAPTKIRIGEKLTKGLGAGGDPTRGMQAAEESHDILTRELQGADMVFITAGMGGGTGTGAAPVIADIARSSGALTVAFVTKPFSFEGTARATLAHDGLERLKKKVDALIVIPNDRILDICPQNCPLEAAFKTADEVLRQGIVGITELITVPGNINVDFADIRTIMEGAGAALMSIGTGSGPNRAVAAAKAAIICPLLDSSMEGAKRVLYNITGGTDLTLAEVNEAASIIRKSADPDAQIIFGVIYDSKKDDVRIILIAGGFPEEADKQARMRARARNLVLPLHNDSEGNVDVPAFLRHATR